MTRPVREPLATGWLGRWQGVAVGLAALLFGAGAPVAMAATAPAVVDLTQSALTNRAFRRVLLTGDHLQVTVMQLLTGQAIGVETHEGNDQLVIVVDGRVRLTVAGDVRHMRPQQALLIPAGASHDVQAEGDAPAKLIVIYAPPLHPAHEVQVTRPKDDHGR